MIKYIRVIANVRYWEDCSLPIESIPFRNNDTWEITIDISKGLVLDWNGVKLKTFFKVCDRCNIQALDSDLTILSEKEDYVPSFLSIDDKGYGDYILITIEENGTILNWNKQLVEIYLCEKVE
jgi:hypothetical protein